MSERGSWKPGAAGAATLSLLALCGCAGGPAAAPGGEAVLRFDATEYPRVFDAALRVCVDAGLPPSVRDRRGGAIWTDPAPAPTLLEPWRPTAGQGRDPVEDTLNNQRRSAVLEFRAAGAPAPPEASAGADLLALGAAGTDLTRAQGGVELRVSVLVERLNRAGLRRDTWSRRASSAAVVIDPATGRPLPATTWVAVGRDPVLERRLLEAVGREIREGTREGIAP